MNFLACFCPEEFLHHSKTLCVYHFAMVSAIFVLVVPHDGIDPMNSLCTQLRSLTTPACWVFGHYTIHPQIIMGLINLVYNHKVIFELSSQIFRHIFLHLPKDSLFSLHITKVRCHLVFVAIVQIVYCFSRLKKFECLLFTPIIRRLNL